MQIMSNTGAIREATTAEDEAREFRDAFKGIHRCGNVVV